MPGERWTEVKTLLDQALDLSPTERERFLDEHCHQDDELRSELASYLELEQEVDEIFETPLVDLIAGRPPEYRAGQCIGPYQLTSEIARGGMGVVYHASRIEGGFSQEVAIKVLKRGFDTGDFVRRFRQEQQILAGLVHPNIVRLLDGGATEDGLPYLVMEAVEGTRLQAYCAEQHPDVDARLAMFLKICDAVHFAHQHMVVHCDLRPSNILVTPEGEPKLLDFGIAKVLQQGQDGVTHTLGLRLGTPAYSSPEQGVGAEITTANDVYSLGGVLYLMLTGEAPRPALGPDLPPQPPSRVIARRSDAGDGRPESEPPVTPDRLRGDLDAIALKALSWAPEQRYNSVAALADDLRRHRQRLPVVAQPYSWRYVTRLFVRRNKRRLAVAAVFLALVVGAVGTGLALQLRAERQELRANSLGGAILELFEFMDSTSEESAPHAMRTAVDALLGPLVDDADEQILVIHDRLGRVLKRYRELDEAEEVLTAVLQNRRNNPRTSPRDLAASLNNLATVHLEKGNLEEAEALLGEAHAIHQRHPEIEPAEALDVLSNLGELRGAQRRWPEARDIHRTVLERRLALHGRESVEVAKTLNNLGRALIEIGGTESLQEAEPLLRQSVDLRARLLGENHSLTARPLVNLGALYLRRVDLDNAIQSYRQAVHIRNVALGTENGDTAITEGILGFALLTRGAPGDVEEATPLLRKSLGALERTEGPLSERTLVTQRNLAAVLLKQSELEEAERQLREVLRLSEEKGNRKAWRLADARSLLGEVLMEQGRFAEARPLLEGAAEVIAAGKIEQDSLYERDARARWQRWLKEH